MNFNHIYNNPLAVIFNEENWKISNLSPMKFLQYDIAKLKQYALTTVNNLATSSIINCEVIFEKLPPLKPSAADPNTLMITVTAKSHQILYRALLVSWGVGETVEDAIHLPYMLERGRQTISTVVKNTLQALFGCEIVPNKFSQHQLLLFTFYFVQNDNSNNADALIISYKKTDSGHNYNLNVSFEIGYIRTIWNRIKNEIHDVQGAMLSAYHLLQNEVRKEVPIDIPVLLIKKVALPQVQITDCGVVKMKTPEFVDSVFTVLNKISYNL